MDLETTTSTNAGWYLPDGRQPQAPQLKNYVYPVQINRSRRAIGWYQSLLNREPNPFHSELERQTMLLLDVTPNVRWFGAQQGSIEYKFRTKVCTYTPDLHVELLNGQLVLVEVKPKQFYSSAENVARARAIRKAIRRLGAGYRVVTDEYLAREPRRSNVRRLQLYRPFEPDPRTTQLIDMLFGQSQRATVSQLANLAEDPTLGRQTVMSLILRRHLTIDLNSTIHGHTVVRRTHR